MTGWPMASTARTRTCDADPSPKEDDADEVGPDEPAVGGEV